MLLYSQWIEPNLLTVTNYSQEAPNITEDSKIVFFTDTHFGELYNQSNIEKIVQKINSQRPDLIIFGGDFFDNYAQDKDILDIEYIQTQLSSLEATYGKYAVYGNHDYGGGAMRVYKQLMSDSGFTLLTDKKTHLDELNLTIIGYDDYLLGHVNLNKFSYKKKSFQLIITHEPDIMDEVPLLGKNIILAGHSHGGQVSLPVITKEILPIGAKKYVKGHYSLGDGTKTNSSDLFVSSGIGLTAKPYRFLNPPEILVLQLEKSK